MDKLNKTQFEGVLEDVRKSYRLLALYQERLLEVVKYVGNKYNHDFDSGWAKFSRPMSNGNRAKIEAWSWDWLTLYLYEFNMGYREIGEDRYHFKIVHQADTGFYDKEKSEKVSKTDVEQFESAGKSKSRLFFVLSKNEAGCPMHHLLNPYLSSDINGLVKNGNWIGVPYEMSRFMNQESTDQVLKEFNQIFYSEFQVEMISKVEEIQVNE